MKRLNTVRARTPEQRKLMEQIEKEEVCPFCFENFVRFHPKEIVLKTNHWFVSENMSPYENAKFHYLVVAKRCISKRCDLTKEEWMNLQTVVSTMEDLFQMEGSSLLIRSGDWNFTGGSVSHLHAHLIMGTGDPSRKVRARVG